jgi:peptide/nickel transport system substrate-binding protein
VKPTRISLRLAAIASAIVVIAAACGSSGGGGDKNAPKSGSSATTIVNVPQGGTLTIGAEQEPDCMDWLDQCAGLAWGVWIAQLETVPNAFRDTPTGTPNAGDLQTVPGSVLAGAPTYVPSPIETITYKINPKAVWSDNVPITCADFQYTAAQIKTGSDILSTQGYDDIDKVACPDPQTVVVTYKKGTHYSNWTELFAAGYGILPSHILKGKDRDKLMKNGYKWSGGPWMMQSWNQGTDMTLVPNPNYWGPKPHLDKVVFTFTKNSAAAEFQAVKSGQVDAIYPQPQPAIVNGVAAGNLGDLNTAYSSNTATVEGLWINNAEPPFDSVPVRQAFAYAVDRQALVQRLFGPLGVSAPSNSFNPYVVKDYSDQNSFAKYHLDLNMVNQLMTGAGWTKGSDGIWAKGGKKAALSVSTTSGNDHRLLTEQVMQSELKDAGFQLTIKNVTPDALDSSLTDGTFQSTIFGNGLTSLTPGLCGLFCSENIPSDANQNGGQNITRTNISGLDSLLHTVDQSLDDSARMAAAKQADGLIADNVASLPLDPLPDVLIWNKRVVGPIQDNSIEGMFWNLDQWGVTS